MNKHCYVKPAGYVWPYGKQCDLKDVTLSQDDKWHLIQLTEDGGGFSKTLNLDVNCLLV